MRDRLIELLKGAETKVTEIMSKPLALEEWLGIYADYLIENGVIVPPCKVGQTVYVIKYCRCGNPECFEMKHCYKKDTKRTPKVIDSIMLVQKGKRLVAPYKFEWKPVGTICYKIIQKPFKLEMLTEYGKTVFLSRELAEKALAEKGGEE